MTPPRAIGLLATRNRHELAHRAAHMFFAQQYAGAKTLYVYDDSPTPFVLCDALRAHDVVVENLAPIRLPAKRNQMMRRAIEQDPNAIYFVWDDDDYNGPQRLARQVAALEANPAADGCIFCPYLTYDVATRDLRQLGQAALQRMRVRVFTDAVIAFRRKLWDRLPWDEAIDPNACWRWMREPHDRIIAIPGGSDYVVIRHATNHTAGMLPKVMHPQLWTYDLDAALTSDDVEQLLVSPRCCTDQRRRDPPACEDPRTAR